MRRPDTDRMLSEMTASELAEWQAFARIEPIGEARGDFRNAYLMSLLANINRSKDRSAYTVADFLIDFEPEEDPDPEEHDEQVYAKAVSAMQMLGYTPERSD